MTPDPISTDVTESVERLRGAGWSVGVLATPQGKHGLWIVSATDGTRPVSAWGWSLAGAIVALTRKVLGQ